MLGECRQDDFFTYLKTMPNPSTLSNRGDYLLFKNAWTKGRNTNQNCRISWDFDGGPVVKNPQCRGHGLIPGRGTKIPHASGQLSTTLTAGEAQGPQ